MAAKLDRYEFIWRAIQKHGYKYDYRKVNYINNVVKVCIICPEHGEFWQRASGHLAGYGCKECSNQHTYTTEEFIEKAKAVHGDKYDYSNTVYKGCHNEVCVVCPIHGEFWQKASSHLHGYGCPKCGGTKKLTTEEFIEKARKVHRDKYDYSKVEYKNYITKVCIICHEKDENGVEHGEFWQLPSSHLDGFGCSKCSNSYIPTTEEWIEKVKKIHEDKYDYSKVNYTDSHTKVCIICSEHGEFWQAAYAHLQGKGCPKCANNIKYTTEEFIEKSKVIHGNKYDYSKVDYQGNDAKVCIICPVHGEFWQQPNNHLNGKGCIKCAGVERSTTEEFIEKAREVHGDKYDYSKVDYVNANTKVCIICPVHGEFWQQPADHLDGHGCSICNESKLEKEICNLLINNNIHHERQKRFEWLGKQSLDFFLPNYNIAIECQGIQHFEPVDYFGSEKAFNRLIECDNKKYELCKNNGIKILYYSKYNFPNYPIYNNNNIFNDTDKLIEYIKCLNI